MLKNIRVVSGLLQLITPAEYLDNLFANFLSFAKAAHQADIGDFLVFAARVSFYMHRASSN